MDGKRESNQPVERPDAVTGATSLADAAAGRGEEPTGTCDPDAVTGATPGVASACREFGMASVDKVVSERGIRPPGVA